MKTYETKILEIVFDDKERMSLNNVYTILDTLVCYHGVEQMTSTATGEVLTEEDLDSTFRVLSALLDSHIWSVQTSE